MVIDGRAMAAERLGRLKAKVKNLETKPKLVALIVGEDPASKMYVSVKIKRAGEVGIDSETIVFNGSARADEIEKTIKKLNADETVTGILVQLPFPKGSTSEKNQREILETIDPLKDVDCLTSVNMGLFALSRPRYYPATVKAVLVALEQALGGGLLDGRDKYVLGNKRVVVAGRSDIVGKPLAIALINLGATVMVGNSRTEDLGGLTRGADILVLSTGIANLVKANMVKKGAIVIDCGAPEAEVDFGEVSKVAGYITPVPGGVGPLTVVSLLENTYEAFKVRG